MIKRYVLNFQPGSDCVGVLESLLDIVNSLLDFEISRQVIIHNDNCDSVLMLTLTLDDHVISEKVSSQLAFIISSLNDEHCVERWSDGYFKYINEKYPYECLLHLLNTTEDAQVAKGIIFFFNLAIKTHLSVYDRCSVCIVRSFYI